MGPVNGENGLNEIRVMELKQIHDERGAVMHMIRRDSPFFTEFGEIYFSMVNPGVIKGWKKHRLMTQNFAVPCGQIKLVIYDDRENSLGRGNCYEIILGQEKYSLVQIPPGVWYSFKALSEVPAIIANCTNLPFDPKNPQEVENLPWQEHHQIQIPYIWES